MVRYGAGVGCGLLWLGVYLAQGQLDPQRRELIQLGYNQPMQGNSPIGGYGFYYMNRPDFHGTNLALRLAVAPIYADAELGFRELLGPHTDLAAGLSGGGFADSYFEIREGDYERGESFIGHGGGASVSLYHLFNPGRMIPLYGVARVEGHYQDYTKENKTADDFDLPGDQVVTYVRTGLRWGGREPVLFPEMAMELSVWYEGQFRGDPGPYGFNGDRELNPDAHQIWTRGLLIYTLPELQHNISVSLTLGTSLNVDRFSAYRLGGMLPLSAEFPLALPGYYVDEISTRNFVLFGAGYLLPLEQSRRWGLVFQGATAGVDYAPGLAQPGNWHSGVSGGVVYRSTANAWHALVGYAYGVDAMRDAGRGAHSVGILLQFDLAQVRTAILDPSSNLRGSRWLDRSFRR